ncbi:hypothetical protein CH92_19615 [Stutzerimonas stutzeri]|uniref:DUF2780 domain-containing protein n=1 Tax=Stutzerimonas stutzeri TaxID=316 RepID=W8R3J6_STUST|nr:DUF2780 domain-containing protein [Stutzerimonas stutzeri]AHL77164.1 hypothetical protein CH92_19615 [Stutzerimonas stutzeri]MCQ4330052.1 DUF2780 domain-containing protein [Stutzerimonas stutzeri]
MKLIPSLAMLTALSLAAGSATAFNLGEAAGAVSGITGKSTNASQTQALSLVGQLDELGVTPEQALGGSGALLQLAKEELSSTDYAELAKSVPGIDKLTGDSGLDQLSQLGALTGLLGKSDTQVDAQAASAVDSVESMADVNQAFSALGMDAGMVGQFAPMLLEYLGGQGVGGSLLQSLGSIWGVGGS